MGGQFWSEILLKLSQFGYIGVAIVAFLEGATVPLPGMIFIFFAGALVGQQYLNEYATILTVIVAYMLGAQIPYWVSRKLKQDVVVLAHKYLRIPERIFKRAERYFLNYGEITVLILRPTSVGTFLSYFAGLFQMKYRKFMLYTVSGYTLFAVFAVKVGKGIGRHTDKIAPFMHDYASVIGGFLLIFIPLYLFLKARHLHKRKGSGT